MNKKNLILTSIIFICTISIFGQTNFTLKIIDSADTKSVLYFGESFFLKEYCSMSTLCDSSFNKDGSYLFSGILQHPTAVRIYFLNDKKYKAFNQLFFIQPGYQEAVINRNSNGIFISKRPNTEIENEYQNFLTYSSVTNIEDDIPANLIAQYIKKNSNSYVAFFKLLEQSFMQNFSPEFKTISAYFSKEIIGTNGFGSFKRLYLNRDTLKPLNFFDENKKKAVIELNNSDKSTLLVFWFGDCYACIKEMKELATIYNDSKFRKKVRLIYVSVDDLKFISENVKLLKQNKVLSERYWDVGGEQIKKITSLKRFPSNLLINEKGVFVAKDIDIMRIQEYL